MTTTFNMGDFLLGLGYGFKRLFCVSRHDRCFYLISYMYVTQCKGGLIEILQGVILKCVSTLIETYLTDMVMAGLMSTKPSLENIRVCTVKLY